jgi:hypothetical protein
MFSSQRFSARGIFAFVVVTCLFTALLFTGCKQEPDDDPKFELDSRLIGTWTDPVYFDGYTITATSLSYGSWSGIIRAVTTRGDAGVIIIEYEEGKEQTYNTWGQDEDGNWIIVGSVERPGNFLGIYYRNLIPGESVEISNALDLETYGPAEAPTLNAAKNKFTLDATDNYIGMWGGPYAKE